MARRRLTQRESAVVNSVNSIVRTHRPRVGHVEFIRPARRGPVTVVRVASRTGQPIYSDQVGYLVAGVKGLHVKRLARAIEALPNRSRAALLSGRTQRGDVYLLRLR